MTEQGQAVTSLDEEKPEMQERAMMAVEAAQAMQRGELLDLDDDWGSARRGAVGRQP